MSNHEANVPIPTATDTNIINELDGISQSNIYVIDQNGNDIQPVVDNATDRLLVNATLGAGTAITGSTSTATDNVELTLGDYRKDVDFFVDVNGSATLTVEVRTSGGTWRQFDTVSYSSGTTEVEQYSTAFAEIRASVDQNLTTLEASAKGV